jgi:hypothetical protein
MTRTCKRCESHIPEGANHRRLYCTEECRQKAINERRNPSLPKYCLWCGNATGTNLTYCCTEHAQLLNQEREEEGSRCAKALQALRRKHQAEDRQKMAYKRFWDDSSGCWVTERKA